eukprot:scaffold3398_cov84-Skeletonema_dohrnii-CCMP3373.AAC.2
MLCDTDTDYSASEKGGKELGTSAVDDVNQSCLLYCAICIFVASWDKREGVFTSVFVALVLVFGYV